MSPVFDRHEITITERPAGERYTHQATCDCTWQGLADSQGEAEELGRRHQAARGYVPQAKDAKKPAEKKDVPPPVSTSIGTSNATAPPVQPGKQPASKPVTAPAPATVTTTVTPGTSAPPPAAPAVQNATVATPAGNAKPAAEEPKK